MYDLKYYVGITQKVKEESIFSLFSYFCNFVIYNYWQQEINA